MYSVNKFLRTWVVGVLLCIFQNTNAAWLRCFKGSLTDYTVTPLEQPTTLMTTSCIDLGLPTVIYTFGYRGRVEGPATTAMLLAYITTGKRNVILLDWEEEAKSGLFGVPLGYAFSAVPNAKTIGIKMGDALIKLTQAGMNMTKIHLLGHSLGAHIMAFAGRHAREKGYVVSRITGLDPARALFEGTLALHTGIDRTCAKFVDIVHSDPGGYGTSSAAGTVDIWPNLAGEGGPQPGCLPGDYEMFTQEDLCDHDRAWKYFAEAINSPTAFPAIFAKDYAAWLAYEGDATQTVYLGDLTSTRARGNFYLSTNAAPLFGKGAEGLQPTPNNNTSRKRRRSLYSTIFKYFR